MADTLDRKPVTVSREYLFRQIWATPMSRLAREYGISGNGLAKICDRLNVPYSPRSYWAKKAAGRKVVQYRLPERKEKTPRAATITATPPPAPLPEIPPKIKLQVEDARTSVGAVAVPARLARPHPIVAAWLTEREEEQAKARRDPWMRNFRPPDWTASERRRHRILDALFKAAERQGVRVKQPDRFTLFFETSGERVNFKLSEKQKQVRVPKTPAEMQGLRPGEKTWRQQLQPTGFLSFSIETYLPTLPQRVWGESTDQPLEEKLGDILAVLLLAGPLLVKQRREREQAEKRRREALRSARQVPLRRPPRSPSRASPSTRSATPAIPAWRFALERIRRVHSGLLQPEVSQHRETLSSHVATALLIDISAWLMVFDGCAKLLRNRGRMDTYGSHSNVQPFVAQSRHFRLEIPKSGLV